MCNTYLQGLSFVRQPHVPPAHETVLQSVSSVPHSAHEPHIVNVHPVVPPPSKKPAEPPKKEDVYRELIKEEKEEG